MAPARAYLGIPYATAARFERPKPVTTATDFERCTAFGPAAPQRPGLNVVPECPVGPTDERACLTLNVWTPAGAHDPERKPVLVWFHGGSFVTGSSAQRCFDGTRLAVEHDVVVVTANYRLGALGFLDLRTLGGDVANLGLHDAIEALRWVQANIESLGGDPERVTIFGESAGGGVCLHLLASAATRHLFASAIVQSGVTNYTLVADRAALVADALCRAAGVTNLAGLRALPVDAVLDAQDAAGPTLLQSVGMMPFHPCVDDDLLRAKPADALAAGVAAGVPLVAGSTADEMRLFLDPNPPPIDRDRLVRRVGRYVGVDEQQAETILATYEREADGVWSALFSDVEMLLPLRRVLEAQARHAPTYAYLFTWEAPAIGAAHAVDIPFTFGNFVDGWDAFVGYDANAERLSHEMRDAWAAFARDHDPGWPGYPATRVFGRDSYVADRHPLYGRLPVGA
ncbi:MAG: carboxylesterase family protein [Actinobacteria bacterium]|nr:carboxylesterase family protein [Actinomycetota bacterium]